MTRAPLHRLRIALLLACCLGVLESMLGCSSDPQKGGDLTTQLTADDARDGLISLVRDDPDLRRACGGERFVQTMSVVRRPDATSVEIGPFECDLAALRFSMVANSDRHGFVYEGKFAGGGAKWNAVLEKKAHTYK